MTGSDEARLAEIDIKLEALEQHFEDTEAHPREGELQFVRRLLDEARRERDAVLKWTDNDQPLSEDEAILAAHPMRDRSGPTGPRYVEAMRLVGAKRSKGALVDLVNWLLADRNRLSAQLAEVVKSLALSCDDNRHEFWPCQLAQQAEAENVRLAAQVEEMRLALAEITPIMRAEHDGGDGHFSTTQVERVVALESQAHDAAQPKDAR